MLYKTIILTNSFTLSEGVGLSEKCDYIISYLILSMESDECSSSVRSNWLIKASTPLAPHKQSVQVKIFNRICAHQKSNRGCVGRG